MHRPPKIHTFRRLTFTEFLIYFEIAWRVPGESGAVEFEDSIRSRVRSATNTG